LGLPIEHTGVIIRRSRNIWVICIGGAKLYDLRSFRSGIEVANGLDPFCDGFLEVWAWACNSCGYTAASIVPCDDDLKRSVEQSIRTRLPNDGWSEIQTHVRHVNMVDTVSHSRDSSHIISEILVGYIPKGKQGPWRSVEDRSFADTAGV
jgi:hypothetical protein